MLQKWSEKQDFELTKLVKKHGTADWNLIRKHFKSKRSRDSVIKRWHGKLKYEIPVIFNLQKTKKINNNQIKKTVIARKSNIQRQTFQKLRTTRSTSIRILKSNINNRFQRLRNFIEGTKSSRTKKNKEQKLQINEEKNIQVKESGNSHSDLIAWNKNDDIKLRSLVINQGIMRWEKIASLMGCSQNDVMQRWRNKIYSTIKLDDKVGGFLKYSIQEDNILTIGNKIGLSWEEIMTFLPGRSEFSIEARWRRLVRPQLQIELSKNKHYIMRQLMKKVVEKKQVTYQPLEQTLQLQNIAKNC